MHFGPPAEIFGVDGIIVLVVVVLVLFGSTQIPKLARSLGSAQKEFKKGLDEGSADDPAQQPSRCPRPTPPAAVNPPGPAASPRRNQRRRVRRLHVLNPLRFHVDERRGRDGGEVFRSGRSTAPPALDPVLGPAGRRDRRGPGLRRRLRPRRPTGVCWWLRRLAFARPGRHRRWAARHRPHLRSARSTSSCGHRPSPSRSPWRRSSPRSDRTSKGSSCSSSGPSGVIRLATLTQISRLPPGRARPGPSPRIDGDRHHGHRGGRHCRSAAPGPAPRREDPASGHRERPIADTTGGRQSAARWAGRTGRPPPREATGPRPRHRSDVPSGRAGKLRRQGCGPAGAARRLIRGHPDLRRRRCGTDLVDHGTATLPRIERGADARVA